MFASWHITWTCREREEEMMNRRLAAFPMIRINCNCNGKKAWTRASQVDQIELPWVNA